MARDRANIYLRIWADERFRSLTPLAQHLYFVLDTHPALTSAGAMDWRPKKLPGFSRGWSLDHIERGRQELARTNWLAVDDSTEELILTTFIRDDGIIANPKMGQAVAKAIMAVASSTLRSIIAGELRKLRTEQPELSCWSSPYSARMLADIMGMEPAERVPDTQSDTQSHTRNNSMHTATATKTATATPSGNARRRAQPAKQASKRTRAPETFEVTADLRSWAVENGIEADLEAETQQFLDHHGAKGSLMVDWRRSWYTWMRNTKRFAPTARGRLSVVPPPDKFDEFGHFRGGQVTGFGPDLHNPFDEAEQS